MIQIEETRTIHATPDAVWSVLGDYMNVDKFAPAVARVEPLTEATSGIGASRRCYFENGGQMGEEVTHWAEGDSFKIKAVDLGSMPLKSMTAGIALKPQGAEATKVVWTVAYRAKFGPFGWLVGQAMMKPMMRKVLRENLDGLAQAVA